MNIAVQDPEVAPQWCCGSSSAADPEIGVSAAAGGGGGTPASPQGPKSGRLKRMLRLAAELLLLLGLLLLTLHITVLRSSPLQQGNDTVSAEQDSQVQVSLFLLYKCLTNPPQVLHCDICTHIYGQIQHNCHYL